MYSTCTYVCMYEFQKIFLILSRQSLHIVQDIFVGEMYKQIIGINTIIGFTNNGYNSHFKSKM